MSDEAGCVKARMVEAALGSGAHANCSLHAGSVGNQERASVHAAGFTEGQRAGEARRSRVDDAGQMGIVEVEAVDQHAVRKRRVAYRQTDATADDAAGTRAAESCDAGHW